MGGAGLTLVEAGEGCLQRQRRRVRQLALLLVIVPPVRELVLVRAVQLPQLPLPLLGLAHVVLGEVARVADLEAGDGAVAHAVVLRPLRPRHELRELHRALVAALARAAAAVGGRGALSLLLLASSLPSLLVRLARHVHHTPLLRRTQPGSRQRRAQQQQCGG